MKILYIHQYFTEFHKNGASAVSFCCYDIFKNKGFDVYFFASDVKPYLEEQSINKFFPKSYLFKPGILNKIKYRINSIYNFEAERKIKQTIKEIQPDIIHIHSPVELSFSILKPVYESRIPAVMTIHDAGFVCPVMGTVSPGCVKCAENAVYCILNKCSKKSYLCSLYTALKFAVFRYLIKKYPLKGYITPSKALKNLVITGGCRTPVYVLPNCLSRTFENQKENCTDKGYFLYAGGLLDIKGVNNLLKAFSELPRNIELHLAGIGNNEKEYIRYAEQNNLHNVKFLGKMDSEKLIEEYKNCIAVIVPSNWFEIFGMVNIEAFACSKPVIASNIGGIPEIVENGINGFLFQPCDIDKLKEYILLYFNNRALAQEHGHNAWIKAGKLYNQSIFYENLKSIYEIITKV